MRLLLVEDQEQVRFFLQIALTQRGYIVDTATSWGGSMNLLRENQYDLGLFDLCLPDSPMENTAANVVLLPLPVIIMSGHGDNVLGLKAVEEGAMDFQRKPITSLDNLVAKINKAITDYPHRKNLCRSCEIAHAKGPTIVEEIMAHGNNS